jgi:histidyl-tRNA synthetase
LPDQERKRQYVVNVLKEVFKSYGFEPLETPALEYEEVLAGKYGEEGNKLMYRFTDQGGRKVALRYDQTVPLARVVAQYPDLPKPFKRYQIQAVWRAENPQKGRFREFMQCDIDTVGSSSFLADAEIIACALEGIKKLGFKSTIMQINDRAIFEGVETKYLVALDKLPKLGEEKTIKELISQGVSKNDAKSFISKAKDKKPTENLAKIFSYLASVGFEEGKDFVFNPLIVRGLDYYTGAIFELFDFSASKKLSLGGGGRYDNLIEIFSGKQVPATGFGFGFDRIVEACNELGLFPADIDAATPKVLVTVFGPDFVEKSIKTADSLRKSGISTELYPDENTKIEKQLKYADKRKIPYAIMIGPQEIKQEKITLKNMQEKKQELVTFEQLISLVG